METRKRALGRGLEELFNTEVLDIDSMEQKIMETASKEEIVEIPLSELRANPYQPRKHFDDEALQELASSISEYGVFQPIIVKKSIKGYEIIAGERRYRASKIAGLETIPAIIRNFSDEQMMEIALLENLQRENLNAIEEAEAYCSLIKHLNLTQDELAKKVGKSRSHVTNIIGLLRLPNEVRILVAKGAISMSHARVISKLDSEEKMIELAKQIIENKMPVRQVEDISAKTEELQKKNRIERRRNNSFSEYKYVEDMMREKLDAKVKIKDKKIEISFSNVNDLNRILEILDIREQ